MAGWPQTMADGGEFGDFVGQGHEGGDGTEGLVGEGGVETGEDDTLPRWTSSMARWVIPVSKNWASSRPTTSISWTRPDPKSSALRLSEVGVTTTAS